MTSPSRPRVYIVGGGFAGLAAAKALAASAVEVTVVDRRNHHVFQPLLYQVATAALAPSDIASPIRTVLRRHKNTQVALAEITGVDLAQHRLIVPDGHVIYDYLILAAGATHAYFGHDDWAPIAPGLKSLEDATALRRRILLAFESAEYEGDEEARRAALTFGIVGGGPTGVELAGAIKEIAGQTIPRDYRHIDTRTTRVILFEAGERLLPPFAPAVGARAQRDLERMGVEVRLNSAVTGIRPDGIHIASQFIPMRNVFWAAGVQASSLGRSLGVPLDRAGRVIVGPDLTVPGHPEVFVVGDMAAARSADSGKPVPGVAQGGIQMGRYAGETIAGDVRGQSRAVRQPFVYRDRGSMAVIGKAKAVAQIGSWHFGGFPAWLLWGGIHIISLVGYRNRMLVSLNWLWNWLLNSRDARLIAGDARLDIQQPRSAEFIVADLPLPFMLTADMKRVVEEQRLGFVATVCPDGTPNLSPKGTTAVWDDNHLIFANIRSPGTMANLRRNPHVEVNVVDPFLRKGYRFKGVASVLESGTPYERALDFYKARGSRANAIREIVMVRVESAHAIDSPAYDFGLTDDQVRARWEEHFASLRAGKTVANTATSDGQ